VLCVYRERLSERLETPSTRARSLCERLGRPSERVERLLPRREAPRLGITLDGSGGREWKSGMVACQFHTPVTVANVSTTPTVPAMAKIGSAPGRAAPPAQ